MPVIVSNSGSTSTMTNVSVTVPETLGYESTTMSRNSVPMSFRVNFSRSGQFDNRVSISRPSEGTRFNSNGSLESVGPNQPRINYDPVTKQCLGLLVEESRTNYVSNNAAVGAALGVVTGSTNMPTNWAMNSNSLTTEIVGVGTMNGIPYIDMRFSGTSTNSPNTIPTMFFNTVTGIAASTGQTWTESLYLAIVGGSTSNIGSSFMGWYEYNSSSVFLNSAQTSYGGIGVLTSTLTRFSITQTIATASTAYVRPYFFIAVANGLSVDMTLRIGLPQMELATFATSNIITYTGARTRSADVLTVSDLIWFNRSAGTFIAEGTVSAYHPSAIYPVVRAVSGAGQGICLQMDTQSANRSVQLVTDDGSVTTSTSATGVVNLNETWLLGGSYDTSSQSLAFNGSLRDTDSPSRIGTSFTSLEIAGDTIVSGTGTKFNGHLNQISYYPSRLSDAELANLTVTSQ